MTSHDHTIAGGLAGLTGAAISWYLRNIVTINDVLQTLLILLSVTAVIIGWIKKGRSPERRRRS